MVGTGTQNQAEAKSKSEAENASRPIAQTTEQEGDYFSNVHHFSLEPNPFEQSFSNTAATTAETPGKSLLPPVAALTSPAIPGTSNPGFGWPNSLRSGPLSPAMLTGPQAANDYFDGIGRGFPTPNESSLRTGLTPGGGGSMFPAPSPSAQVFANMQSGGATPSTLEFQRTALNVARKNGGPTSNPQEQPDQLLPQANLEIPKSGPPIDTFTHPDATDAANGLFMLAKGAQASNSQFMPPTSQPMPPQVRESFSSNGSPMNGAAMVGMSNGEIQGVAVNGNMSDDVDQTKTAARGKGKKTAAKSTTTAGGRRKAEDTSKASNKRQKGANGAAASDKESDNQDTKTETTSNANNNKKLTDEEKRKNFLERNR